jgi:hypothetical protein
VSPEAFCDDARGELAGENADDGWVRGARAVCELYADLDANRFETILTSLATGRAGSTLADGARWLLPRWQAAL